MKTCDRCKRPHPDHWSVPFALPPYLPGLREAMKAGGICSWCHRDYKGRRRPLEDEVKAGQLLHSVATIPGLRSE